MSFKRQNKPTRNVIGQYLGSGVVTTTLDEGAAAGRYSFQRRDKQFEVGGGKIGASKGFFTSDLNSVITESRNFRGTISNDKSGTKEPILPLNGRNRVGHWDMYELASKIKDQIDIEQLIEDKIIRKTSLETFEFTAFQNFDLHSAEHLQNEKTLAYVKKNPLNLGELGFKNSAYIKCLKNEKADAERRSNKRQLPEKFLKLPAE